MNCSEDRTGRIAYSSPRFALAKAFVLRKWLEHALACHRTVPVDLSGACRYGSLFMREVFGGSLQGHYEHQYNRIGGRIVDLSHDAADVGRMHAPYLHEPDYFDIPEQQRSMDRCMPRVQAWVIEFMLELDENSEFFG